jgi:type IV pilus assembly protein PilY1
MLVFRRTLYRFAALAALLAASSFSCGEDIDIFGRTPVENELPNVLIMWDSSANWGANIPVPNCSYDDRSGGPKATAPDKEQGTKFAIEKCAIYNVVYALDVNADGSARYNVGLFLFNESGAPQGGYPRRQFLPLTATNKSLLLDTIRNIAINVDKANNAPYAQAMHEMYLMFAKQKPHHGTLGTKWDPAAVAANRYVGAPGSGCGKNHIIWVSNGSPNENNTDSLALLIADGGDATPLVYPTAAPTGIVNSDQADWADEFARLMRAADVSGMDGVQSITTHAVAVVGSASDGLYPNYIKAIATQGGGQYYTASDITQLTKDLLNIFNAIDTASAVFASASLPISVNASGSFHDQVYIGMFRPDELARPRWYGNLKQYTVAYDVTTDSLALVDSLGAKALNPATGFFNPSVVSYWTEGSTFWTNDRKGTPPSASDLPDGEVVEKGAVAERLRIKYASDRSTRKVYTCVACAPGTILSAAPSERFEDANAAIKASMLGAASSAERTAIIDWVRGTDNQGDEKGPNDGSTTVRPSIHGDVLHSRPAVVDYGSSIGTVVFYGSNDGTLRAVSGNQTGAGAGDELWAFVPSELFGRLKRLRDNLPEIRYPITPTGATATPRDYFVDGPITVYQKLGPGGSDQVMIFVAMRRGGRLLYAFDVTDPYSPRLVWRKSNADVSGLGQTWSEAKVARVRGHPNPVLLIGAGYDAAAEDALPPGSVTMGNAVIVLDAMTGTVLATLPTARSVPAGVAALDTDFDGYTDRLYAVDMAANVYRIDLETSAGAVTPASWTISTIAALGDGTGSRKFYYTPDVVQTQKFTAILVGSGNRERPLLATTNDRFYTLFDYSVGKGAPSGTVTMDADLVVQGAPVSLGSTRGCYMALDPGGEKVVTSAVSTGGYTYFSTNRPTAASPTSCAANLGVAKAYRLQLFCGSVESLELAGGGLPPSPVIGYVDVPGGVDDPNGTRTVPFIIGGFNPALSGLGVSKVPIVVDPTRRRTFWYTNKAR